jgi:flagellum-specific peptidoglycan hydrolase FlgJ
MKKVIFRFLPVILIINFLSSCELLKTIPVGPVKTGTTNTNSRPSGTTSGNSNTASSSAESIIVDGPSNAVSYIHKYRSIAVSEMKRTGVPASIKLAQSILESGYGSSELSKNANNHFGIKCGGDWKGKSYYLKSRSSCFRAYISGEESFREHSDFLKGRSHYADLFKLKITDYKSWAKGLQKAGYATNSDYSDKLIELIERYKLYRFDNVK